MIQTGNGMFFIWFIMAGIIQPDVMAIQTYNCTGDESRLTKIDLLGPEQCLAKPEDYLPDARRRVQIVQVEISRPIKITQCRILETATITRCGYDSLSYGTNTVRWMDPQEVPREDCLEAGETGKLRFRGNQYTIKRGVSYHERIFSRGGLDEMDNCLVETWTEHGRVWKNSYEEVSRTIEVHEILGTYDEGTGTIKLEEGLVVVGKEEFFHDAHQGSLAWRLDKDACRRAHSEIYHGMAVVREKKQTPLPQNHPHSNLGAEHQLRGTLVLATQAGKDTAMGFKLHQPIQICERQCWSTQLDGILTCLLQTLDAKLNLTQSTYTPEAEANNIGAQLAFLHLTTNQRISDGFTALNLAICQADHNNLKTKLQALASGSRYMLNDRMGPGHQVIVRGAAAYVSTCAKRTAVIREVDQCYAEIPVTVEGRQLFADPITFNLQEHGTPAYCSKVAPIMWRINGRWHCSNPGLYQCQAAGQVPGIGRDPGWSNATCR